MPLIDDQEIGAAAHRRESFRLTNVSSKLTRKEAERLDSLAHKRQQSRGELIRRLILDEFARESQERSASAELTEIIGLRLLLTNALRPIATGQKVTPEAFDNVLVEVKRRKKAVALEVQQEVQGGL